MDTPTIITLDLSECKYIDDMHQRIKMAFDFPDYYGENWDAFWDLIEGLRSSTNRAYEGGLHSKTTGFTRTTANPTANGVKSHHTMIVDLVGIGETL